MVGLAGGKHFERSDSIRRAKMGQGTGFKLRKPLMFGDEVDGFVKLHLSASDKDARSFYLEF